MKKEKLYNAFEDLIQRLGLKILKGRGDFRGGRCIINNKKVIVVNTMKPMEQRLRILALSVLDYDLNEIYIIPALRAYIEDYKSQDS